jgi:hypothetical protein
MRKWIGVMLAAGSLLALSAASVGAGTGGNAPILTIRKVVVGSAPAGTQFVVAVNCDGDIIRPGGPGSSNGQRTFDAQGNPVGSDAFEFVDTGQCTVTETQTGGAVSTSYECESAFTPPPTTVEANALFGPRSAGIEPLVCGSSGPQSEPMTVNIVTDGQEATVTVTNTFAAPGTPPPIADAVVAGPRFTGSVPDAIVAAPRLTG